MNNTAVIRPPTILAFAICTAAFLLLSCAPGEGPDTPPDPAAAAEPFVPGSPQEAVPRVPGPEDDTVGVFIARTTAVLDSLEEEARTLAELIPPALLESSEHEGPEYFVMFYYWLYEARDVVDRMQGLLFGLRFEQLVPEVEDRIGKTIEALDEARKRIAEDRAGR